MLIVLLLCNYNLDQFLNFNIMDNLQIKGPLDRSKINLHQEHEVKYWCEKFGCTVAKLQEAVHAVGVSTARVKEYLGK